MGVRYIDGQSAANQDIKIMMGNKQVEGGKTIKTDGRGQKTYVVSETDTTNEIVFKARCFVWRL